MRCSPAVNADRLKTFFELAGPLRPRGPSPSVTRSEHEVELLLNRRRVRGVTRYLVRWRGHSPPTTSGCARMVHCRETLRRCRPPPRHRPHRSRGGRHLLPPRCWWSMRPASGCRLAPRWPRAPSYWVGRCCTTGPAMAGFVGLWSGVVGSRGFRAWSGTALGRRWAPRWSTRCSMPPRTGQLAAGSCCARRAGRPVELAGRP